MTTPQLFNGDVKLILGPPGTGKTTYLLERIDDALRAGIPPERIAFYSFTRAAVNEATDRAKRKFAVTKKSLKHFRTLHSESWRSLKDVGYTPELLNDGDMRRIGSQWRARFLQPAFFSEADDDTPKGVEAKGDVFLRLYRLCRSLMLDPHAFRKAVGEDYFDDVQIIDKDLSWTHFIEFYATMSAVKDTELKLDFSDLIDMAATVCDPLDVDIGFVDEAQDLSKPQWLLCSTLLRECPTVYVAGDDDQAIYQWSGADLPTFRSIGTWPNCTVEVLGTSHRLPRAVWDVANRINTRIDDRYEKVWTHRDEEGEVHYVSSLLDVPLGNDEPWLVLARNERFFDDIAKHLKSKGIAFYLGERRSVSQRHWKALRLLTHLQHGHSSDDHAGLQLVATLLKPGFMALKESEDVAGRAADLEHFDQVSLEDFRKIFRIESVLDQPWWEVLSFTQSESDYYRAVLRRHGPQDLDEPKVRLLTVHSAKGQEERNVLLLRSMSSATWKNYLADPDTEHRVFYVGVTRARQRLYLLRQRGAPLYYRNLKLES